MGIQKESPLGFIKFFVICSFTGSKFRFIGIYFVALKLGKKRLLMASCSFIREKSLELMRNEQNSEIHPKSGYLDEKSLEVVLFLEKPTHLQFAKMVLF